MQFLRDFGIDLFIAVAAFFGGIARIISDMMNGAAVSILMMVGRVVVAIFCGWCLAKGMLGIGLNQDLVIATASLSGWLGIQSLDYLAEFVRKKLAS